jgi:hypothetical protein
VISRIDISNVSGDRFGGVAHQEGSKSADIVDRYKFMLGG